MIRRIDAWTRFDRWGPSANPLTAHLLRQRVRLSLRAMLWWAFGLGLAGLAIRTWTVLHATQRAGSLWDFVVLSASWALTLFAPLIATAIAAYGSARRTQPERFELIYLTPLSNHALLRAQVFAAVHQARWLWLAMIALMPYLIIHTLALWLAAHVETRYTEEFNENTYQTVIRPTLVALAVLLGLWSTTLLGATVGVWLGRFRRAPWMATLGAPLVTGLFMVTPLILFIILPLLLVEAAWDDNGYAMFAFFWLPVIMIGVPLVCAALLIEYMAHVWRR